MKWSLRNRVGAIAAAGALLITAIAVILVLRQDWRLAEAQLLDDLIVESDQQDRGLATKFDLAQPIELDPPRDGDSAALYDLDGTLVDVTGPIDSETLDVIFDEFDVPFLDPLDLITGDVVMDDTTWGVVATGCIEEGACSALVVARERSTFSAYLLARASWVVVLVVAAGAAAAAAARWATARALGSVDRMRRTLDEITASDLSQRMAVPPTGDELESLAISFNHTIERLQAGVETQRRFTSDAAHELRTPITGTRATLEVGVKQPERAAEAMLTAIDQLDRTSRLLDDLLLLARMEAGGASQTRKLCDVDDIVAVEARELANRNPGLVVDRSGVRPVQARVAHNEIVRVVRNLLDNAAAHASNTIRVCLDRDGDDGWTLRVEDDGPGIPVTQREAVFARFTRLDDSRTRGTGGTGLGLSIVRELVDSYGGRVTIQDSDLGGAAFVARVPAGEPPG
ncbi:MAG: ATP-binding protein [Acidimicrobiia bacterium]|nr:ATP-binding protein [Acidimicrobiia bacterium]